MKGLKLKNTPNITEKRFNNDLLTELHTTLDLSKKAEKRYRAGFSKAFIPDASCSANAVHRRLVRLRRHLRLFVRSYITRIFVRS